MLSMKLIKTLEHLLYLGVLILMFKLSESATLNRTEEQDITGATVTPFSIQNAQFFGKRDGRKLGLGDCDKGLSWMCLKMDFVRFIERMTEQTELNLLPGVAIVKDTEAPEMKSNEMLADIARSYPNDPSTRLNGYIVAKLTNFMQSRFLRLKLVDDNAISEARSSFVGTGRKDKFGKKGGLEALMAAGLVMKGTLLALGLGGLAMLAGKALMTALMALTISGILGLKGLTSGKSTTYEIVAKPVYTSSHTHSDEGHGHAAHYSAAHSGYGRSLQLEKPSR